MCTHFYRQPSWSARSVARPFQQGECGKLSYWSKRKHFQKIISVEVRKSGGQWRVRLWHIKHLENAESVVHVNMLISYQVLTVCGCRAYSGKRG